MIKNLENLEFMKELDKRRLAVDQEAQKNAGGIILKHFKKNLNKIIDVK